MSRTLPPGWPPFPPVFQAARAAPCPPRVFALIGPRRSTKLHGCICYTERKERGAGHGLWRMGADPELSGGRRASAHNRPPLGLSRPLGPLGAGLGPGRGRRAFGAVRPALDGRLGDEGRASSPDGPGLLAPCAPPPRFPGRYAAGGGAAGRRWDPGADAAAARPAHARLGRVAGWADDYPAALRLDAGAAPASPLPPHRLLPRGGLPLLGPGGYRQRADRAAQRLPCHPAVGRHGGPHLWGARRSSQGRGACPGGAPYPLPYAAWRRAYGGAAPGGPGAAPWRPLAARSTGLCGDGQRTNRRRGRWDSPAPWPTGRRRFS